jgi:hypothetical protein
VNIALNEFKQDMGHHGSVKQKIVLPKGIINFTGTHSRQSSGGSKSADRTTRRVGHSHEPRESQKKEEGHANH